MRTILVIWDTLNRSALGCYGGTAVPTPNFDRFAQRAQCFDNHYVGSLPCMPARRDLHTGRMNFMHRSWGPLEPFDNSLPALLGNAGVYSHLVTDHFHYFEDGGANYHTRYTTWELIRGQEYDSWKPSVQPDLERYKATFSDKNYNAADERNRLQHQINRDDIQEEADHPGPRCISAALDFLDRNRAADNWFLQLECFDPHEPFFAPDRYKAALPESGYNGPVLDWPRYGPADYTPQEIAELRRNYHALAAMCDAHFGRLLDDLDAHDMWRDTAVIVTTDHGFLLGEHDWWGKNTPPYYEEISHIPLMVHLPDRPELAGQRSRRLTQTHDLMPTILDLHSVAVPPEVRGQSLLSKSGADPNSIAVFGQFGGPIGASDGRHAFFLYPKIRSDDGLFEYTLMPSHLKDPFDTHALAQASLAGPFDFTKSATVLRVPAEPGQLKRPPGKARKQMDAFDTALYDLIADPGQLRPIEDRVVQDRFVAGIISALTAHDAPEELYQRFGLSRELA